MKLRKEKYIVVTEKNNHTYITVKFTYKSNNTNRQITKTFSVSDYPTPSDRDSTYKQHKYANICTSNLYFCLYLQTLAYTFWQILVEKSRK